MKKIKEISDWYGSNIGYSPTAALAGMLATEVAFISEVPEKADETIRAGINHDLEMMASMGAAFGATYILAESVKRGVRWARSQREARQGGDNSDVLASEELPVAQFDLA